MWIEELERIDLAAKERQARAEQFRAAREKAAEESGPYSQARRNKDNIDLNWLFQLLFFFKLCIINLLVNKPL